MAKNKDMGLNWEFGLVMAAAGMIGILLFMLIVGWCSGFVVGGTEHLADKVCDLEFGTEAKSYSGGILECEKEVEIEPVDDPYIIDLY